MSRRTSTLAALALLAGCASPPPPPRPPPPPPASARVVLLPQQDGRPSALELRTAAGQTLRLDAPYAGAELAGDTLHPVASSADDVARRYGALLAQQPARPRSFTVNFLPNGARLTPDADATLAEVRQVLATLQAPEVLVIGHTDRVGSLDTNDRLSLQRAEAVREILVTGGIARGVISVSGRGERDPLVPTADEVAEPRNRRVEIKLR